MKKQKKIYHYHRYNGKLLKARREISYDIQMTTRLILDELCFNWNKRVLQEAIDRSIDEGNKTEFMTLSKTYKLFVS